MLLRPFRLADRLVTNAEWLAFMADGGYRTPGLWLADGWARVVKEGWRAPLYWEEQGGQWLQMTLYGLTTDRRRGARLPHQLFRSRRLCALGGPAAADRIRMGERGGRRSHRRQYAGRG